MISTLFFVLLTLLIICVVLLILADRCVTHAASWESVDRWLVVGSYAAPAAFVLGGALAGAGLAWGVS